MHLCLVKWNSEGCFNEHKRAAKRVLGLKFATIRGINIAKPDIEKVFNMCRVAAEQEGYKIFAIRVRRSFNVLHTFFYPVHMLFYHIENLSKMTRGIPVWFAE